MPPNRMMNRPDIRPVDDADLRQSDIIFYYSREHRLRKASPRVRALYEDIKKPKARFGFFRSLVDTKAKAILLAAIAVISIITLLFSIPAP
jgi:hypothetical protein